MYCREERALTSDDEIVRKVRNGDRPAFDDLMRRHGPMLYAYSRSRVGSEADARELTQDALVEAYLSLDRYELGTNLALWLRSISRNLIRNHYRSLSRRREATLVEALLEIEDPAPPPDLPFEALRRCLEKLDEASRELIEGFYRKSRPVADLASDLGKGVSWVKVVLHRVRYRLRDCLTRAGVEGLS
jgi:RNA polymerase sigma-70 factor (ECF subfamily)